MAEDTTTLGAPPVDLVPGSIPGDWHRHPNGGGWVHRAARVDESAFVDANARVSGDARVSGNARVSGDACVSGNACVYGDACVYGNARVSGNAWVYGGACVYGNARVSGGACVYGDAWVRTPPHIAGTMHALTLCSRTEIAIGCHVHTIEHWHEHYRAIGRANGYSDAQIEEYRAHIEHLARLADTVSYWADEQSAEETANSDPRESADCASAERS